jgi:ketosteroid isomerase-like protein
MSVETIYEAVQRWQAAELEGDVTELGSLLSDDFVGVRPRGFVLDRDAWLQRYRSGDLKNTSFEITRLSVRRYGDIAIVTGTQIQHSASRGRDASGRFRTTIVLLDSDGDWSIINLQLSPIVH